MSDVVEFEHTPQGFTIRTGHPLLGDIHGDFSSVSPDRRQGTARALLVSAALDCFCGTLNAALLARDVHITGTGRAEKVERDGRSFVNRVVLDVQVDVEEKDRETLEHCLRIVKGCLITRSLMEGMEVEVHASRA